jgi:hypothetical protein
MVVPIYNIKKKPFLHVFVLENIFLKPLSQKSLDLCGSLIMALGSKMESQ